MNKKRVAIIFGGVSPEHEVSLMSAMGILSTIDRDSFQVVEIGIAPDGLFYSGDGVLDAFKKKTVCSEV